MHPNELKMLNIQAKLQDSLKIIRMYDWLLDSYVLVSVIQNKQGFAIILKIFFVLGFLC